LKNIVNIDTFFASGNEQPHAQHTNNGMDWMQMTKNTSMFRGKKAVRQPKLVKKVVAPPAPATPVAEPVAEAAPSEKEETKPEPEAAAAAPVTTA